MEIAHGTEGLTPFVPGLRDAAREALTESLTAWLALGSDWSIALTPKTDALPTRVTLRTARGASIVMCLHTDPARGWIAGPLGITFEKPSGAIDPAIRAFLGTLGKRFEEGDATQLVEAGAALAKLHARYVLVHELSDRDYRHFEQAHNGRTGHLRVGFRCNQDCHFCWEGRTWPDPPDDVVMHWLDELAALGAKRLTLCGGEPTIFRMLPDLVERAAKTHGMQVHMNTNAIRLKQAEFTKGLVSRGLHSVLVSLHSVDPEVSDRMTRAPGTHARTVAGLHAALDAGLLVIVNCCVERTNVEGLEAHARWIVRELVDAHPDNPVRMVNYSQPGPYYDDVMHMERMVSVDEARPHVSSAGRILGAAGVLLEIAGSCGFPSCVASEITELVPWRASETFDAHNRTARSHGASACASCAARDSCIGPRREYLARYGERGLVPFQTLPKSDWYERLQTTPLGASWTLDEGGS